MDLATRREAYIEICRSIKPDTFVTLATNQTWTIARTKRQAGKFFGRMDRWYLGHTWLQEPIEFRTDGIGFIEHVNKNTHAHVLARFGKGNRWGMQMMAEHYWSKLCEGGSVVSKPIHDLENLADYCTKEMRFHNYDTQDQILFLRDYFPA